MLTKLRFKNFSFWKCFLVIDILIALLLSEIWIRSFIPVKNICYITDDEIGVRFCPNQETYGYVEKGYSNVFKTNSLGFHDIERTPDKKKSVYRIHVYGDSMIQGFCVKMDETIPALLESLLNEKNLPVKFEVMNMAPGDDSVACQIRTYQTIGQKFKPDLVISYFMDDFPDNLIEIHHRTSSPYYELDKNGKLIFSPPIPKDHSSLWERFKKASMLYRLYANKFLASKFYYNLVEKKNTIYAYYKSFTDSGSQSEAKNYEEIRKEICIKKGWPLTLKLIEHFKQLVEANGTRFILVDGKAFEEMYVAPEYVNNDLETFCQNSNIDYIPAYIPYEKLDDPSNGGKYFFKDHHLKATGNKIVCTYLAGKIESSLKASGVF
jgi:hypothetical protein